MEKPVSSINQLKKTVVIILLLYEIGFKAKTLKGKKRGTVFFFQKIQYTLEGSFNSHVPNDKAVKYVKQKLT